jgi:dephospho-CoA kinase
MEGLGLRIIALVGMPGSGKEEFVKVSNKQGYQVVRMGDVVREEVEKRGLELIDENIGSLSDKERRKSGMGIWAKRTLPHIKDEQAIDKLVIDGIRGDAELAIFREKYRDSMIVVGIHASPKTRFDRIVSRGRQDASYTWKDFSNRDQRELDWGIGNALALSDIMIINESSMDTYVSKIESTLEIIEKE